MLQIDGFSGAQALDSRPLGPCLPTCLPTCPQAEKELVQSKLRELDGAMGRFRSKRDAEARQLR